MQEGEQQRFALQQFRFKAAEIQNIDCPAPLLKVGADKNIVAITQIAVICHPATQVEA